jgi:hypothetical protein
LTAQPNQVRVIAHRGHLANVRAPSRFYQIGDPMRRLLLLVVSLATLLALATPASAMNPNFFDQLDLKQDRHIVAAGGPCHWQAGDAWAEISNVRIEQGGVVASSGTASTIVRKGRDSSWWLDATSSSQLTRGPAEAYALAVVHRSDGSTYEYPWYDDVQLR